MLSKINKNKWRIFALMALISLAVPFIIIAFVLITTDKDSVVFFEDYNPVLSVLIILYYAMIIAIGIVWLIKRIMDMIKLRNETVKNELRHLQSQVNPHFFFNMLNNLYGLVDKDVPKAKQLILKLSDMMRYSIYDGQKDLVTIKEEVDYLNNYIALHQMRYHKKSDIKFEMDIVDEQLKIMPLMFINLVENAFKHGMEHLRSGAFVHIKLKALKNSLTFEVMNNYDAEALSKQKGVGLENLKRRLTLMYPKKHNLSVEKRPDVYVTAIILHQL